jgi:hypothetical protein
MTISATGFIGTVHGATDFQILPAAFLTRCARFSLRSFLRALRLSLFHHRFAGDSGSLAGKGVGLASEATADTSGQ